jgi:hypothetical protein
MLDLKRAKFLGSLVGLISFSILVNAAFPLPGLSQGRYLQGRTYTCARRSAVRVCVGQMIRLPGLNMEGQPRVGTVLEIGQTHMAIGIAGSTLFEDLIVLNDPNVAVGSPPGSYPQTCRNVSVDGNTLYANCQRIDGSWIDTSIYFYDCTADGIANTDGRLTCARE